MIFGTVEYDRISPNLNILTCYNGGDMHGPHLETRTVTSSTALALDITQHLSTEPGKAVVVGEQSAALTSFISKKWQQQLRPVEREHASTLDTQKREELSRKIAWMRSRTFAAASKPELLETTKTDVLFCTTETLLRYAPACHAMYITHPIEHKTLHLITAWMKPEATVICYHIAPKPKQRLSRRSVNYRVVYGAD